MSDGQRERVSERRLVNGWPSAPRVRIRQARADDLDAVANLVSLAGVRLEPELVKAVVDGTLVQGCERVSAVAATGSLGTWHSSSPCTRTMISLSRTSTPRCF